MQNTTKEDPIKKLAEAKNKKICVGKVEVNGLVMTRSWFIEQVIQRVLNASTFGEIIDTAHATSNTLGKFGIYKEISVQLETEGERKSLGENPLSALFGSKRKQQQHQQRESADMREINVIFDIKEKPRIFLKTGTEIGANEASISSSGLIRNVCGGAETLEVHLSRGTRTKTSYQILFKMPYRANPDSVFKFRLFQDEEDWTTPSSYMISSTGLQLAWNMISFMGQHEFSLQSVWREVGHLSERASLEIRDEAGNTVKNSISHTLIKDTRNHPYLASEGHYFKWFTEFACFKGNTGFLKSEVESSVSYRLPYGMIFSSDYKGGILLPLRQERTKIADRFFLGGPLNVRGFQSRGIGPRSTSSAGTYKNDSLGGDMYFAAGFNLFTPFPFLRNYDALKTHFFWNGGLLLPVEPGTSNGQLLNKIASVTPSSSIGFGFALRTDMCRAELNWVHPVTMYNTDILNTSKLQFGIGMSFL